MRRQRLREQRFKWSTIQALTLTPNTVTSTPLASTTIE
jgi:hypothetical protein